MNTMDVKRSLALSIVCTLNEALKTDRDAIEALIEHRVPCNEKMMKHPTIQATIEGLGMLGVINGIVGTIEEGPRKGWGLVTAVFTNDGKLVRFMLTDECPLGQGEMM